MKNTKGKKLHKSRGFTLIELIISVAIVTAVLIPIAGAFANAARENGKAKRRHNATLVAQNVMEKYKYMSLPEIKLLHNIMTDVPSDGTGVINLIDSSDEDTLIDTYVLWALDEDGAGGYRKGGTGNYYVLGPTGNDAYYCKVTISPEAYISAADADVKINSYKSPNLTNLFDGNTLVISDAISYYDSYAASKLGFSLADRTGVTKKVTIRAITSHAPAAPGASELYKTDFYMDVVYTYGGADYSKSKFLWHKEYYPSEGELIPEVYCIYNVFDYKSPSTASDYITVKHKFEDSDLSTHTQNLKFFLIEGGFDGKTATLDASHITTETVYGDLEMTESSKVSIYTDVPGYADSSDATKNEFTQGTASNSMYLIKVEVYDKDMKLVTTLTSTKEADYGYTPVE